MEIIEVAKLTYIPAWCYIVAVVLIMLLLPVIFHLRFKILIREKKFDALNIPMVLLIIVCFLALPSVRLWGPTESDELCRYKARLDNTYPAVEFYDKYENLKYLGDGIYEFQDKEVTIQEK